MTGNMPEGRELMEINLKLPEPTINPADPWSDDLIGRKELADRLTAVVETAEQPMRLSLQGEWGTGKTYLLRRWQQDLENRGFRAIYYNAWEDDLCSDPLLGMLGQLHIKFKSYPGYQETLRELGKTASRVMNETTHAVLRSHLFDVRRIIQAITEDHLSRYSDERETRRRLRRLLEDIAGSTREKTWNPLVFVVDELDRCRPAYAVECLERIKHVMEIPGIVFVLGINRDQLCASIRHVNGDIDAPAYLQRFFDLEFNLPDADVSRFCAEELWKAGATKLLREAEKDHPRATSVMEFNPTKRLMVVTAAFCKAFGLSLRETQQWTRIIALAFRTRGGKGMPDTRFLEIMPVMMIKNPRMYRRLKNSRLRASEVVEWVKQRMANWEPDRLTAEETIVRQELLAIEVLLILINRTSDRETHDQLESVKAGENPIKPELLSPELRRAGQKIRTIAEPMSEVLFRTPNPLIDDIFKLIDLERPTRES